MSTEDPQAVARRAIEARNAHDVEAWVALWSEDWRERARAGFLSVSATFPDVHITPEEWVTAGDKVVLRWTLRGTHLGPLGGIVTTPVINHPEVAIIGVNRIVERPVFQGDAVVKRALMNLSSSFDHRVVDGMDAARFIQAIRALLETPALLFVE